MTAELEAPSRSPQPAAADASPSADQLRLLGEAVHARWPDVLRETVAQTSESGEQVDAGVQQSCERICTNSTVAVSRPIAGDGLDVTLDASRETSHIFGELAAHRGLAARGDKTELLLAQRDGRRAARVRASLEVDAATLTHALNMLQMSLEFSHLRVCECFERERMRTDEELTRREEELAFLATHDPLTGLPNRTLILARVEQMLARSLARRGVRSRSPRCSSTSTTSRASTTRSATASATNSFRPSRPGCEVSCERPARSGASGAMSSW